MKTQLHKSIFFFIYKWPNYFTQSWIVRMEEYSMPGVLEFLTKKMSYWAIELIMKLYLGRTCLQTGLSLKVKNIYPIGLTIILYFNCTTKCCANSKKKCIFPERMIFKKIAAFSLQKFDLLREAIRKKASFFRTLSKGGGGFNRGSKTFEVVLFSPILTLFWTLKGEGGWPCFKSFEALFA